MMKPEEFDFCYEWAEKIHKLGDVGIALQPLLVDMKEDLYSYTDEQKLVMQEPKAEINKRPSIELKSYRGSMTMISEDGNPSLQMRTD